MATLSRTSDGWSNVSSAVEQTSQTATYTFETGSKYTDRNIVFKVTMPGVVIPTPTSGVSTFYITIGGITYNWKVDSDNNVWIEGPKPSITFTIDGVSYTAEADMTWQEWVSSDYNINKSFRIKYGNVYRTGYNQYVCYVYSPASSTDMIIENRAYSLDYDDE